MMIQLSDILDISDPSQYKLHLACRNEEGLDPLEEFVISYSNWRGWNTWRGKKNDWTRDYVLSFIEFQPRKDSWLFGGAFKVLARSKKRYDLEEVAKFEKYVGRLIVSFHRYQGMRGRAFYFERYVDQFKVSEILPRPYTGESFSGFENIELEFRILERIVQDDREDWKGALSNAKGVYLICDKSNGKKYVGSAYGRDGIWSRWSCYIGTGHGWNDDLTRVVKRRGIEYARQNFRFSVLEIVSSSMSDEDVLARESHWKRVLLSREYGYNRN